MSLLIAIIALALMTAISVALFTQGTTTLTASRNQADAANAFIAAESGLQFMTRTLSDMTLPADIDSDNFVTKFAETLSTKLDGNVSLSGDGEIIIPSSTLSCGAIDLRILQIAGDDRDAMNCRVLSIGTCGTTRRTVSMDFECRDRIPSVLNYGIASKGPIEAKASCEILGTAGSTGGPDVLSTSDAITAIDLGGTAIIAGDLALASNDISKVSIGNSGNVSVGGTTDPAEIIGQHVALGVDPEWPTYDIDMFRPYATNIIDSSSSFKNGDVYENILVKANTNPVFRKATLRGVIFIEYPNTVNFRSETLIEGIIVAEEAPEGMLSGTIDFRAQTSFPGVEALPDTEKWAEIKKLTGTTILAPSHDLTFRAHSSGVNGLIVGQEINFRAQSGVNGDYPGPILSLSETFTMEFKAQSTIMLRTTPPDDLPVGVLGIKQIVPAYSTYNEALPGE